MIATSPPETRDRLLEAAGEVFAAEGYRNTTVRRICGRAGANLAAINYHFRGKAGLYAAVLEHAQRVSAERYPPDLGIRNGVGPDVRLRAFVHALLLRTLDRGRPAWHGQLMLREMAEPTPALDAVVRDAIRPPFDSLRAIVRELLGRSATPREVTRCAFSIVGQCLFFKHANAVIARLEPGQRYGPKEIRALADHIAGFSLAAMGAAPANGRKARA